MYLLPIHVPIFTDGEKKFLSTEWHRSVCLLRESLGGRFGKLTIAAPSYPAAESPHQRLVNVTADDGIELIPSFDDRVRCRDYWLKERSGWLRTLEPLVKTAQVVHAAMDDVFRPISFAGFRMAAKRGGMCVLVQDTDIVLQSDQLTKKSSLPARLERDIYSMIFERCVRWGVKRADLSLLKGSVLMQRYGRFARNAKIFHDTSHSLKEIVPWDRVSERLNSLGRRPLRLVFCGRLEPRKGVMQSLELLKRAGQGGRIEFDIIGDGSERAILQERAQQWGLAGSVRFLGRMNYGPELIAKLATYDGLLFTPAAEDTPRMIFDGYAASLPLIGFDIDYVRERDLEDHAALLLPRADMEESAKRLVTLVNDPSELIPLATAAHVAAKAHAVENWYSRRAAWTFEAYERHAHQRTLHSTHSSLPDLLATEN